MKPYKIEREWEHAGLHCAVVEAREGFHRCGYVRVPPGHPLHGKGYDDEAAYNAVSVHGGLTFAELEPCTDHADGQGWWFGFDCCHAGDEMCNPDPTGITGEEYLVYRRIHIQTAKEFRHPPFYEHYWTQPEVERETERLAEQLAIQ